MMTNGQRHFIPLPLGLILFLLRHELRLERVRFNAGGVSYRWRGLKRPGATTSN
jgi:hypothetical protein